MGHDTNWDVEKYRSPHEPKHHWELKRKFMELNKERFPEHRLAGMAQTLGNIEFMGCVYPKDTMDMIDELSYGLTAEFRSNQNGKIQRTFVSGSDAANRKVNRK